MIKIFKVLGITSLALIGCLLFCLSIFFMNKRFRSYNDLLYLIRMKKYYRANIIIEKKYDKVDINTKRIYDSYKLIIDFNQNVEEADIEKIQTALQQIEYYMKDANLPEECRVNCYLMKSDYYLLLYNITNDSNNLLSFQTSLNELREIILSSRNRQDNLRYYNYEVSRSNLIFKAYYMTNDTSYLNTMLANLTELRDCIIDKKETRLVVAYIDFLLSRIYVNLYDKSLEQPDLDNALQHIKNIEKYISDKSINNKYKKYGKIYLISLYHQITAKKVLPSIQKKYDTVLSNIKLNKKEKEVLNSINNIPSVDYLVNLSVQSNNISNKIFTGIVVSLVGVVIAVFIYTSVVIFKPSIDIRLNTNIFSNKYSPSQHHFLFHTNSKAFMKELNNNLLENGLSISDELSFENSTFISGIYLDDRNRISLMGHFSNLRLTNVINVSVNEVSNMDWDNEIVPYLVAIIQAEDVMLTRDEAIELVSNLYNESNEPSIKYIYDRKYTFTLQDDYLHLSIQDAFGEF